MYRDDPAFSSDPRSHPYAFKPLSTNVPRRARMKAFVCRLAARHNLDRIDELDETDPFGGSYHHDGPYEAIGTNLAQPPPSPRAHRLKHESDPLPLPPQYTYHPEIGLSLHLEPGQILQPDTIYSSHLSSITAAFTPADPTRRDPSRRQSLPRTRHHKDTSPFDLRDGRRAPRAHQLGDCAPHMPIAPPSHHDPAPYVHSHSQKSVLPPPRYESRLYTSAHLQSPQHTPPPSFRPKSPQPHSTENAPPPCHDSRHKTAHSLDSSHSIHSTRSTMHNKPLEPPRMRHLPKRLVMPAPLQPQPPQPVYEFPQAEPPSWQDVYPDDLAFQGAHFQGKPAMYSQEPRLLRKKTSAFPAKTPIPDHAPMSQDDAAPIMEISSAKTVNEAEETKEGTRRRRLSKRKSAI